MHEDDRAAPGDGPLEFQEEVRDASGATRICKTIKFPIRAEGGPAFLGGISVDITDRTLAEKAMRKNEARLESLIRINQHPAASIQELLDFVLEEANDIAAPNPRIVVVVGVANKAEDYGESDLRQLNLMMDAVRIDSQGAR